MQLDKETLQVVPLGGLGEIGKNMTAVRQASGMILVDAGMSFPDEEMPGIDLVLPDFTYLREHADELKGIVLTHGHEDHVGALPYLLREFNVPVYATRLTLGLVRSKLQEFGIKRGDLREIKAGDTQNLGGFGLEFIQVNHSIPGAVAIAIRTKARIIVASFASHIHRVSQVVEAAKAHDRLVGVSGRSMIRNVQIARELGYLDL